MVATIILPIKYSTAKKWTSILPSIIQYETYGIILCIVGASLQVNPLWLVSGDAIKVYGALIIECIMVLILIISTWVCIVIYEYVEPHFPHLECIKDEEDDL